MTSAIAGLSPMKWIRSTAACMVFLCVSVADAQPEQTWLNLLNRKNYSELEAQTTAFQKRFAEGQETEFALRQAYRPFYQLTEYDLFRLDQWQQAFPNSYSVRLIRGTYYKRAGQAVRGSAYANETPPENLDAMARLDAKALPPLEESLSLTETPFLSIFHLLDLQEVDAQSKKALMDRATKILPSNTLVRSRYMRGLTPRWGGSYEAMNAYLEYARHTGATKTGLMELQAIIFDDMGKTELDEGDAESAARHFRQALELGSQVGGEVPQELYFSSYYKCRIRSLVSYCR